MQFKETSVSRLQSKAALMTTPAAVTVPEGPPVRDNDGFYHLPDGTKLLSVTTIIGLGVPKNNLVHWAAWEVARCAMDYLPRLIRARGDEQRRAMLGWLQKAAERKRDDAANLGIAIHDAAEAYGVGAPWPEPTDEQRPFVDAFARFCERWNPRWEAAEMVVGNLTEGYAGKGDAWMWLAFPDISPEPILTLVDYKTGKSCYPEVAMQLSAYANADVGFLRDGTRVTPPKVNHAVVVHIRPSRYPKTGGYRVIPIDISDETYAAFLTAKRTALDWTLGRSKEVLGKPYPEPNPILKVL